MDYSVKLLNYVTGKDNLNRFRYDLKAIFARNTDFSSINLTKEDLVEVIRKRPEEAKRKHMKIGTIWAIAGGLISLILSNFGFDLASKIIAIFTIVFALEIPFRLSIIDATAYKSADNTMSEEELIFRKGWNALMFKTHSLAILILPAFLLKIGREQAYDIVMEQIEYRYLSKVNI